MQILSVPAPIWRPVTMTLTHTVEDTLLGLELCRHSSYSVTNQIGLRAARTCSGPTQVLRICLTQIYRRLRHYPM